MNWPNTGVLSGEHPVLDLPKEQEKAVYEYEQICDECGEVKWD